MAREFTHTTNLLVIGLLLGSSSLAIGVTALFLSRIHTHTAIIIGAVLGLAGLGIMVAASATGSVALLLAWCIVGGVGYSFAFTGGLTLLNRTAPAEHRGATLSLLYLFAYLLQAGAAVGAGALATALGLRLAIDIAAPVVAILCLIGITLAAVDVAARRRAVPLTV